MMLRTTLGNKTSQIFLFLLLNAFISHALAIPISLYSTDPSKYFITGGDLLSQETQDMTPPAISAAEKILTQSLSQAIKKNTNTLSEEAGSERKLLTTLFDSFNKSLEHYFKNFHKSQQKALARQMYGEQARTTSVCNSIETAVGLSIGKKIESQVRVNLNGETKRWNTRQQPATGSGKKSTLNKIASINHLTDAVDWEDLSNEKTNPESETLTNEEVQKLMLVNKMVINPMPSLALNSDVASSKLGERYEDAVMIHNAELLLSDAVKNHLLASKSGAYNMDGWAQEVWEEMGGEGTPDGLVDGKMSSNALLSLLVDSRLRSVGWNLKADGQVQLDSKGFVKEEGGNEVWAERESLMNQAILARIYKEDFTYLNYSLQLMAEIRASDIAKNMPALNRLHARVINEN